MKPHEAKNLARQTISDHPSKVKEEEPDPIEQDEVESMHIEPIDNGYMAHTHMKSKKDQMPQPKKSFFKTHHEVAAHVAATFGQGKQ